VLGNIVIVMRLTNPPTSGGTNQLTISTYDNGILVDQNSQLSTNIVDVDCDILRVTSSFDINFMPIMDYTSAMIVVSNLQVNSPTCLLNGLSINCYSLNGQVFFGNSNLTFSAFTLNMVSITNLQYYPGTYLVDILISNQTQSQSSSAIVILPSNSFASIVVQLIDS
jgi:hypothetical protein